MKDEEKIQINPLNEEHMRTEKCERHTTYVPLSEAARATNNQNVLTADTFLDQAHQLLLQRGPVKRRLARALQISERREARARHAAKIAAAQAPLEAPMDERRTALRPREHRGRQAGGRKELIIAPHKVEAARCETRFAVHCEEGCVDLCMYE